MNKYFKLLIAVSAGILLAGCSFMGPVTVPTVSTYTLSYSGNVSMVHPKPIDASLTLMPVTAARGFDSSAMIYEATPYARTAFVQNAWVSPPASLMTPILLRGLQESYNFKTVINGPALGNTDYTATFILLEFYQDFTVDPSQMVLSLDINLINNLTNRVVVDKVFTYRLATKENTAYGGVMAANQLVNQSMTEISQFLRQAITSDMATTTVSNS